MANEHQQPRADKTYYAQHPLGDYCRPPTLTVGELIEQLKAFDPNLPVIMRSPKYGCFGSNTTYALDFARRETLAEETTNYPAQSYVDDETGEEVNDAAHSETLPAWDGVVIE